MKRKISQQKKIIFLFLNMLHHKYTTEEQGEELQLKDIEVNQIEDASQDFPLCRMIKRRFLL